MMRFRALALAGLVAFPVSAAAQQQPTIQTPDQARQLPQAGFAVTPFVGVRVPFSTGDEFLFFGNEQVSSTRVRREHGGSIAAGLEGEYRFAGPWSLVGTASYSPAGNDAVTITQRTGQTDELGTDGPDMYFGRLGVSLRLPEPSPDARRFRPGGFIVVAPAVVHMRPDGGEATSHPALNLGLQATAPIGRSRRLAFQLGIDDYVTFWNTDALADNDVPAFSNLYNEPVRIDYDYATSNLLMIRLGASFRF